MAPRCFLQAVAVLFVPVASLLRHGTTQMVTPSLPCAPAPEQLASLQSPKKPLMKSLLGDGGKYDWSGLTFYLHDKGAFDMSDVVTCYMNALGMDEEMSNVDEVAVPNIAEHMVNFWTLRQLRSHPARRYVVEDADLHIIGAPIGVSQDAADLPERNCGSQRDHKVRLKRLKQDIKQMPIFQRDGGRNWMLIETNWNWFQWAQIGNGSFLELFTSNDMLLGTVDHNISDLAGVAPQNTVVVPYMATTSLDQPDKSVKLPHDRSFSFVFHGNLHRNNDGYFRQVMYNITEGLEAVSIHDVEIADVGDNRAFANVEARTADILQDSTFCFIPAGDTASTRRLFDALAAGCVPIIFNFFQTAASNLPFTHSVDWTKIVYFAGSLECLTDNIDPAREYLKKLWLQRGSDDVKQKQALGRKTFFDMLSYRHGDPVSAMLGEVGLIRDARST